MWADLSLPWRAALNAAWEASCAGSMPIGSAIANQSGCVLTTGRNRLYEPREYGLDYVAGARIAHAEINALLALEQHAVNPRECILYTTTEPCPMCAGAIVMADVRAVRFAARDPWAGSTDLYETSRYMRGKNMQVEGPADRPGGLHFEALLFAFQAEYLLRGVDPSAVGKKNARVLLLEHMEATSPSGMALGRALVQNGALERMRQEAQPASLVFDQLDGMLEAQPSYSMEHSSTSQFPQP